MPLDLNELKRERNLTEPEVKKIADVVESTGAEEVPFPAHTEQGNLSIVGDPNITKRAPQMYTVNVIVPIATSEYTEAQLQEIAVDFDKTELEYHVTLEVPVTVLSIDRREGMLYALGIVLSSFYEEVEDDEGNKSMRYITNQSKLTARLYLLTLDPDISFALKTAVVKMLDLPTGLSQITVSQAVDTAIAFMEQNPDVINEVDANLL